MAVWVSSFSYLLFSLSAVSPGTFTATPKASECLLAYLCLCLTVRSLGQEKSRVWPQVSTCPDKRLSPALERVVWEGRLLPRVTEDCAACM